ncbi:MAG: DNA polymerase II, partial [Nanoarchaeota archaeon]|nr:DNA polymerase II [Nanoarchaeota archaeon]
MKGYIVDSTYRIMNNKPYVLLFGRSDKGEPFLTANAFDPYFFIKKKDLKKALKIEQFKYEETKLKNFDEEPVTKIILDHPKDIGEIRTELHKEKIDTYEADLIFARRFLIDHKINGTIEIDGDYDFQEEIKVFKDPILKPIQYQPKLKVLSIDIETDLKAKQIYSIAIVTEDYKKVLIRSDKKLKNAESFKEEDRLLERFFTLIEELDPDVIVGWNLIDFDLKVIKERCKKLEVPFILSRDKSPTKLNIRPGFFETSKATAKGRQIIDILNWIRSTTKLNNYKLETVAQHFLGEGKIDIDKNNFETIWKKSPQELINYNLQDAQLVLDIIKKSGVLELNLKKSLLTGLMLSEVKGSISSLDSIYLKKLRDLGYVAPSVKHPSKEEQITGGYVMDSKPGIYENIIVLDFKSIYPSLVRTFNIDPLAFNKKGITAPNKATFSKDLGVMPEIIEELWEVREDYKKKKDEVGRYAIKTLMNSFFGVLASPNCRFFNLDMANAITSFAQFFIKKTADMIREEGYEVIYSDTDSVFVIAGKNPDKKGKQLEKLINKDLEEYIKNKYKVKSYLELEFEKTYTKFIMPKLRGSEKGAKKRYAGLIDGKLDITGMEAVRGDWTDLAKHFQKELLMKVFNDQEIGPFVSKFIEDLKKGKYDKMLVYKKAIRKPLEEYVKITPAHIKAARQLKDFKELSIEYVYTKEGIKPLVLAKGDYDYKHYIDKQLK